MRDICLTDFIAAKKQIKSKIKSAFKDYILLVNQIFRRQPIYSEKDFIEIDCYSAFYSKHLEGSILGLVNERSHLRDTTAVFPCFSEAEVQYQLKGSVYHPILQASKDKYKANALYSTALQLLQNNHSPCDMLLELYLESVFEHQAEILNNPIMQCTQLIIPFLIRGHSTVAVVHLVRNNNRKIAHIKYYDSYGYDLDEVFKEKLMRFFKKEGFWVQYECISQYDQKDEYNCGVFVILKAIDIANENAGVSERLLDFTEEYYYQYINAYRYKIAEILQDNGYNVAMGENLIASL